MIYAQNYWQCLDLKHWESQGFNRSDVLVPLMEQAEAIEITVAKGIYRKTANPDNPDYSLWWVIIKNTYYAREDANIVVEEENMRDWPAWVELRRRLWDCCNQGDKRWIRIEDCKDADDHLWDEALERVCHKLIEGSFTYREEASEGMRQYLNSVR
jgi:hypothetical protein